MRARGANAIMALAFNTGAYGAVLSSGFHKMPFVTSDLGDEQGLIESDLLGHGRQPGEPSLDVVNNTGNVVVPVDLRNFGQWLKLLMGAPATAAGVGDELVHTFTAGAATLPDANIEIGNPDVPTFAKNYGVMGNTLNIELQRSGHLNATIGLIAQGEAARTATTGAGTLAEAVTKRFSQFSGEVLMDGASVGDLVTSSINFSNGLDPVEVIRPDGRIAGADPGMVTLGASVTIRFKDTVMMAKAVAGVPVELKWRWSLAADESLEMTAPRVFLPKPKVPITGPGGVQAQFACQAARDPVTGQTFSAVLTNDVASY